MDVHIAFVLGGAIKNRIRIVDLHGFSESEIRVVDTKNLASLDWSADGTGFFSADLVLSDTRLLHIERDRASQPATPLICGIPSPDGTSRPSGTRMSSNVWIVENP
jgi:hypothetical protein